MLPYYEGEYEPKPNNIHFQSAREILMLEGHKMIVKRRFERLNNMIACNSYNTNEDFPENKEIFVYGFKHIKTDKIDKCILIGCESDAL